MIGMSLHKLKCSGDMSMLLFVLSSRCRANKIMLIGCFLPGDQPEISSILTRFSAVPTQGIYE